MSRHGSTGTRTGVRGRHRRQPLFVIHKHESRRFQYDLRLECGGVLKSWAVAKGPTTDPRVKRLAVEVEDQPVEEAFFEGVIPKPGPAGGAVIVWDTGSFRNITERAGQSIPLAEALRDGHAAVWLEGRKLKGGFALTRVEDGDKGEWLLVKMKDEGADARRNPVRTEPESVRSGRTIEQVARERRAPGLRGQRR